MKPIQREGQRKEAAKRFGERLNEVMKSRGVGRDPLVAAAGTSLSTLRQYRGGYNLPTLPVAEKLARALDDPRLVDIVREGRTHTCAVCKRDYLDAEGTPRRYCSDRCQRIAGKRTIGADNRKRADLAEQAMVDFEEIVGEYVHTVDSFCRDCSPEGVCLMPKCALRPLSPLLLASAGPNVRIARPMGGSWAPGNREKTLQRIREANAERWARPGERERQAALTSRMRADGTIPRNTRRAS